MNRAGFLRYFDFRAGHAHNFLRNMVTNFVHCQHGEIGFGQIRHNGGHVGFGLCVQHGGKVVNTSIAVTNCGIPRKSFLFGFGNGFHGFVHVHLFTPLLPTWGGSLWC